jgi:hypothetical protein
MKRLLLARCWSARRLWVRARSHMCASRTTQPVSDGAAIRLRAAREMSVTMQRIPRVVWLICAVLLVAAVLRLPYGYYSFLRIMICGAAALIAVTGLKEDIQRGMGVDGDIYSDRRSL